MTPAPTPAPRVAPSLRRAIAIALAVMASVAIVVVTLVKVVFPAKPPASLPTPARFEPPLAKQLVLVVVDGLREDVATNDASMPELAKKLRERAGGVAMAGAVSMTSSAVLTFGTGQRGDFEEIVKNESHARTAYEDFATNARKAGLVTAFAGDAVWTEIFPDAWTYAAANPPSLSNDVEEDAPVFRAARDVLHRDPAPSLVVFHFATPDHMGHAAGIFSPRYQSYIKGFDRALADLLGELSPDATVIVTSDHGATDSGAHGSDTPTQRRCPLLAYGPGIVAHAPSASPVDQADFADTFAALLGTSPPAHGRGHVAVDWLDVSDARRADIACASLARIGTYAAAAGVDAHDAAARCDASEPARARIEGARAAASKLDRAIGRARVAGSLGWVAAAIAIVAAILAAWLGLGAAAAGVGKNAFARAALLGACVFALGVGLTYSLELLPGRMPDPARGLLYVAGNVALVAAALRVRSVARFVESKPAIAAMIFPGILVATETTTTQPESLVVACTLVALAYLVSIPPEPRRAPLTASVLGALALPLLAAPAGVSESCEPPAAISSRPPLELAIAVASIAVLAIARFRSARRRGDSPSPLAVAACALLAVTSLVLRRSAPSEVCVASWIALTALTIVAFERGHVAVGEMLAAGAFAWVSRDAEWPVVAITVLVASGFGTRVASSLAKDPSQSRFAALSLVAFLFSWTFVQRVGVQLGVDFVHMDWGAGAFRQADVSFLRIAIALVFKHALAFGAILFVTLRPIPPRVRVWALAGLVVAETSRTAVLASMLYACRASYWTPLRAIGDLPHALLASIVAAIGLAITARDVSQRARSSASSSTREAATAG